MKNAFSENHIFTEYNLIMNLRVDLLLQLYPANIVRVREARRVQGGGGQALRGAVGADERYINVLSGKQCIQKLGFVTLNLK